MDWTENHTHTRLVLVKTYRRKVREHDGTLCINAVAKDLCTNVRLVQVRAKWKLRKPQRQDLPDVDMGSLTKQGHQGQTEMTKQE